MSDLANLKPTIRLSIMNPDAESGSLFGRGKAWRIIKDTEAALDLQLLNRDGAHGSDLTEAGNKLLDTYLAIEEKLQKEAEELFEAAFK